MAIRIVGGSILMVGGAIVTNDGCCCGECCTFDPAVELYLTIDNFTLDGGETCDAGCTGFGVTSKASFGGPQSSSNSVTWFTENCEDDEPYRIAYTMECDGGLHYINMFSGGLSAIIDNCTDNNELCYIGLGGTGNFLLGTGIATCDPFYLQGTLDIVVYDSDGVTECGTGTIRLTITE